MELRNCPLSSPQIIHGHVVLHGSAAGFSVTTLAAVGFTQGDPLLLSQHLFTFHDLVLWVPVLTWEAWQEAELSRAPHPGS